MSEILLGILLAPLAILLYAGGLLMWPVRRWRCRGQKVRGRALKVVFMAQLVAYLLVAICAIFIRLEHLYYWFIFIVELNVVVSMVGFVAWCRDKDYERLQR